MTRLAQAIILLFLTGCGASKAEIQFALKNCEPHGGLEIIYSFPNKQIWCKDLKLENYSKSVR